ncbi:MAG: MFS transporter [Alphaproteobacteria bacterium]|nr:MAG: MFS transporter [Alphaproteobacteria bacterium]
MNNPSRVISFVNAAHFIDHYSMLIFAAAVIVMGPALGMAYSELLPYATPGFVAFGAGSLLTGWLGDRWSRRHMMVIFFAGIGASMIAVGFVESPLQLGAALLSIGLFASIYHPVGTAMIVSYADRLGREMGLNGVWGNLGVASSALVTGVIGQYLGWRFAFIIPGIVTIAIGVAFALSVLHEDRTGTRQAAAQVRVAKQDMWRVIVALLIVVIAISTTFNAVTVALPKLFAERLADLTRSPALLGVIAACVYVFGAMTQYTIGKLLDRHSLKAVALPLSFMLAPFLYLAATLSNWPLILVSIGIVMGAFGQVTVNDAMIGKYTSEEWRSRAYAVRYFVGFTAAGASVGLVAWLYQEGGFVTMLHAFGALCLLVIAAALILPRETGTQLAGAN